VSGTVVSILRSGAIASATIISIVALAVLLFFNPVYVGFEQARTGADVLSGYTAPQVASITGQVLSELYLGPATFEMTVNGDPVFDPRERAHLADVRSVLFEFLMLAFAAVLLLAAVLLWRSPSWAWRAMAAGTRVLAGAVVVLAVVFGLFFEQAFDLFHRLFFGAGTYNFDPRVERLVQLFPDAFWFETSLGLGVVILLGAIAVRWVAMGRVALGEGVVVGGTPHETGGPA